MVREALPQPMHCHASGPFVQTEAACQRRIINRSMRRHEATFERLEILRFFPSSCEFGP